MLPLVLLELMLVVELPLREAGTSDFCPGAMFLLTITADAGRFPPKAFAGGEAGPLLPVWAVFWIVFANVLLVVELGGFMGCRGKMVPDSKNTLGRDTFFWT